MCLNNWLFIVSSFPFGSFPMTDLCFFCNRSPSPAELPEVPGLPGSANYPGLGQSAFICCQSLPSNRQFTVPQGALHFYIREIFLKETSCADGDLTNIHETDPKHTKTQSNYLWIKQSVVTLPRLMMMNMNVSLIFFLSWDTSFRHI